MSLLHRNRATASSARSVRRPERSRAAVTRVGLDSAAAIGLSGVAMWSTDGIDLGAHWRAEVAAMPPDQRTPEMEGLLDGVSLGAPLAMAILVGMMTRTALAETIRQASGERLVVPRFSRLSVARPAARLLNHLCMVTQCAAGGAVFLGMIAPSFAVAGAGAVAGSFLGLGLAGLNELRVALARLRGDDVVEPAAAMPRGPAVRPARVATARPPRRDPAPLVSPHIIIKPPPSSGRQPGD